ncbi:hypothetical protein [Actinoplanes sp. NPDC049802]|uniref:hypothetical protein n=1 Tax=Actinoplanes sp. NPDC049802 TaxID=3154742 RepID=UPI0033D0E333
MSDSSTLRLPIPPPEPPAGRARQRWLLTLIAALATLVLALPVAVYLLLRDGADQAAPTAPPPSSSAPPVSPSSGPATPPAAPDGRIPLATLGESVLDVPAWPADNVRGSSGPLRFHDGTVALGERTAPARTPPYGMEIVILSVTYGDVDGDGADETVAELSCRVEGGSEQLVAFDRDRAGRIVTIGPVVATTGEIRDLREDSARVAGDGTVTVQVADYQRCCDDRTPQTWQKRGYRLGDDGFHQVSGPARMPVNPWVTDTTTTAGRLVLTPATDGYRYGAVEVTVTHVRGARPARMLVRFHPPAGLEPAGDGWPPITREDGDFTVTVDPPAAYGAVTRTFAFRQPVTATAGRLDVEAYGLPAKVAYLSETTPWDNAVTVR